METPTFNKETAAKKAAKTSNYDLRKWFENLQIQAEEIKEHPERFYNCQVELHQLFYNAVEKELTSRK